MDKEEEIVERMLEIILIEKKGLGILLKIRNRSKNVWDHKKVRKWIYEKLEIIRRDEEKFRRYIEEKGIFKKEE